MTRKRPKKFARKQSRTDPGPGDAPAPVRLPTSKKIAFAAVAIIGLFFVVEVLLALVGVRPTIATSDPYVGFRSASPLFVKEVDTTGFEIYRTAVNKRGLFNDQKFAAAKGSNTLRIFCMGGSTTHGRPYRDKTSFPGWLRLFLQNADPSKTWEVINCGGVSYASYRVAALMEELGAYDPDMYVIYTGNNEFLERRTYAGIIEQHPAVTQFNLLLHRSRIVSVVRNALDPIMNRARKSAVQQFMLTGEVKPILDQSAGLDLYERDQTLTDQILSHFRFNVARITTIARSQGAQVVFIQPSRNVKDFSPFKSQHAEGLSDQELNAWTEAMQSGRRAVQEERLSEARDAFQAAIDIDDRYAESHFLLGRALFELGDNNSAAEAFDRALSEDVCPLRVLREMNTIIAETSAKHSVAVVDFEIRLKQRCLEEHRHSIPGSDYFIDHVHPTIETNKWIAELVIERLEKMGVVHPSAAWNRQVREKLATQHAASVTPHDHAIARGVLAKVLRWAGKIEESNRLLDKYSEVLANDAEGASLLGQKLESEGRIDEALAMYQRAVQINPGFVEAYLHIARLQKRQLRLVEAVEAYEAVLRLNRDSVSIQMSLGALLAQLGRNNEAVDHFVQAIKLEPNSFDAQMGMASVLLAQQRYSEAINACNEAWSIDPKSPEPARQFGYIHQRMGQMDTALDWFRKAVSMAPRSAAAKVSLAQALARQGNVAAASTEYAGAIELNPESGEAYFHLGLLHAQQRDYQEAVGLLQRAVELLPESQSAVSNLGLSYMRTGEFARAVRTFRTGIDKWPNDARMHVKLAWLLAAAPVDDLRDGQEALHHAERAVELNPTVDLETLYTAAAAHAELGDFNKAIELAQHALQVAQQSDRADFADYVQQQLYFYQQEAPFRIPTRK